MHGQRTYLRASLSCFLAITAMFMLAINPGSLVYCQGYPVTRVQCRSCHTCDQPTRAEPCLVPCPKDANKLEKSSAETPDMITVGDLSSLYGPVSL